MSDVHKHIREIAELNPQYEIQCRATDTNRWYYIRDHRWEDDTTYRLVNKESGGVVMESRAITDPVAHPAHYTQGDVECIDAMVAAFGESDVMCWARLNAFKYLWRSEHRAGVQDLKKAVWYLRYACGDDPRVCK